MVITVYGGDYLHLRDEDAAGIPFLKKAANIQSGAEVPGRDKAGVARWSGAHRETLNLRHRHVTLSTAVDQRESRGVLDNR